MTYAEYDFDGFIELDGQEMTRLKNGDQFLTVIRQATQNSHIRFGHPGDTLAAREVNNVRPQFNLRMISNFFANGQWIMIFSRLNTV
jgi:hypothetical protein